MAAILRGNWCAEYLSKYNVNCFWTILYIFSYAYKYTFNHVTIRWHNCRFWLFLIFKKEIHNNSVGAVIPGLRSLVRRRPNGPCRIVVHGRLRQPPLPSWLLQTLSPGAFLNLNLYLHLKSKKSPRFIDPALATFDFSKLVGAVIPRSPKPCAEET